MSLSEEMEALKQGLRERGLWLGDEEGPVRGALNSLDEWMGYARKHEARVIEQDKALALAGQTLIKLDATNNALGDRMLAAQAAHQAAEAQVAVLVRALERIRDYDDPTGDDAWHDKQRQEIARSALASIGKEGGDV